MHCSKHILMTTTAGAVYDVSRHVLDPRRPNMNTPIEMREPGLPPYIPELQFPPEVVLNYNQSVAMPKGIRYRVKSINEPIISQILDILFLVSLLGHLWCIFNS